MQINAIDVLVLAPNPQLAMYFAGSPAWIFSGNYRTSLRLRGKWLIYINLANPPKRTAPKSRVWRKDFMAKGSADIVCRWQQDAISPPPSQIAMQRRSSPKMFSSSFYIRRMYTSMYIYIQRYVYVTCCVNLCGFISRHHLNIIWFTCTLDPTGCTFASHLRSRSHIWCIMNLAQVILPGFDRTYSWNFGSIG